MTNKSKGTNWERQLTNLLNEKTHGEWKRVPGSGALGTNLKIASLTGDVIGSVNGISRKFKIEAKTGYGGNKQLAVKKIWFDKIVEESKRDNSIPMVACKFSNAKSGVKYFVSFPLETFIDLLNEYDSMYKELVRLYDKLESL